MKTEKPDQETLDRWHDDPKNWKAGLFYYNPEDKRIFPPKRISALGWTVNFANTRSVLVMAGIMVISIVGCILIIALSGPD